MSRLIVLSLPPGWELLPPEARDRLSTDVRQPMKATARRGIRSPGGEQYTSDGRTMQEATAAAVSMAWHRWFAGEMEKTGGKPQLVEAPALVDANAVANSLLPPGYQFINANPLRTAPPCGNTVTGYTRGVLIPGGVPGAGPSHTVQGTGSTPQAAVAAALMAAWKHAGDNTKCDNAAPTPDNRPRTHVAREKMNHELCRSLPPGYEFCEDAPRFVAGKWHDSVSAPGFSTIQGNVHGEADPVSAAKAVQQASWKHYRELRGISEPNADAPRVDVAVVNDTGKTIEFGQVLNVSPGTGKTRAMIDKLVGAIREGQTVVVASPSLEAGEDVVNKVAAEFLKELTPQPCGTMSRNEVKDAIENGKGEEACDEAPDLRRRAESGWTGATVLKGPQLPPDYAWGEFRQTGNGWNLTIRRPRMGGILTVHAPSKHEAVELGNRTAWTEHKRQQEMAPQPVPPETLAELLSATVRRHLTTYTVPPTGSGATRAAAFVRILPPGYRHRDAAPVASSACVSPTVYTDVVEHWSGLTTVLAFQATDVDAATCATRAALRAWEHYEQKIERRDVVNKFDQPLPPGGYEWNGLPVPPSPIQPAWTQSVSHPGGYLSGKGGTAEAARREGHAEAWAHYKRAEADKVRTERPGGVGSIGEDSAPPAPAPHGFREGDRVRFRGIPAGGDTKYNADHLRTLDRGTVGTVQEPPNEGFPADAVQEWFDRPASGGCGGVGAVEARLLELVGRGPDKMPAAHNASGSAGVCSLTGESACPAEVCPRDCPEGATKAPEPIAQMVLPPGYRWHGEPVPSRARPGAWVQEFVTPQKQISGAVGTSRMSTHTDAARAAWEHFMQIDGGVVSVDPDAGEDMGHGTLSSTTFAGVWS